MKRKHRLKEGEASEAESKEDEEEEEEEEEDSDLVTGEEISFVYNMEFFYLLIQASLAREFAKEEIQQSPFLKRRDDKEKELLRRASQVTI